MFDIDAEVVLLPSGTPGRISRLLGSGSQGEVFEFATAAGDRHALKWYRGGSATESQRMIIGELISRGSPDDKFAWPTELVEVDGSSGFGYLMTLVPPYYRRLRSLLHGEVQIPFRTLCTLTIELADSFLRLHSQGLCYRDISFGNLFFDPENGRPLICDNDNVGIDGVSASMVLGTARFMAPEIVRYEAEPSIDTDLHSLAVLLFYILMVGHPLLGRQELDEECLDRNAELRLLGEDPVFVFDPENDRNRPDPEHHDAMLTFWPLYPQRLRDLFTQTFTIGLREPRHGRVRESVWRRALLAARDLIAECEVCGAQNFWEIAPRSRCWSCDEPLHELPFLEIGGHRIALGREAGVTAHHVYANYDLETVLGRVAEHPERPGAWGLRNESTDTWTVVLPNGHSTSVPPNRMLGFVRGAEIRMLKDVTAYIH